MDIVKDIQKAASSEELMYLISSNISGVAIYLIYVAILLVIVIAGTVLLIVNRKKFTCNSSEMEIPKGHRFTTVILNVGMILYCILWIGMIIIQLCQ